MNRILDIPEIAALDGLGTLIRIPNQIDIPVTPRVLRLLDTPQFQRLKQISQLGLVNFVYPGAHHNRFEHSLGVYRMGLLFLRQLAHQSRFTAQVSDHDASVLILAALLHDLGHWPFCHPIEDLSLDRIPSHEEFGCRYVFSDAICELLDRDWGVTPHEVVAVINRKVSTPAGKLLCSILSGPIDIDKLDYLYRDSLHCGVPYGQNFDLPRLIRSLCVDESGEKLAITHKGKTAAELLVFARYVMFSEVYWHHAVRSATAMFQRGFYRWYQSRAKQSDIEFAESIARVFQLSETDLVRYLMAEYPSICQARLIDSLFGRERKLYKRIATYSCVDGEAIYRNLAQRPYPWLVELSQRLASELEQWLGRAIDPDFVLIDAPPIGLEVQFQVQVHYPNEGRFVSLEIVSPVVQTLAKRQFDDFVKQVRIFVDPSLIAQINTTESFRFRLDAFLNRSLKEV
jgi:uncharacterized protein